MITVGTDSLVPYHCSSELSPGVSSCHPGEYDFVARSFRTDRDNGLNKSLLFRKMLLGFIIRVRICLIITAIDISRAVLDFVICVRICLTIMAIDTSRAVLDFFIRVCLTM